MVNIVVVPIHIANATAPVTIHDLSIIIFDPGVTTA
jgi:hypothetical protein